MNAKLFYIVCLGFVFAIPGTGWAERAAWVGQDFRGMACEGELENYGPYDYRNSEFRKLKLPIVEEYHFTTDVQRLIKGKSGYLIGDIEYTLRAFPNHYKALNALMYYQLLKKDLKHPPTPAVECYFYRALNFAPTDATLHMLFAVYLKKLKQYDAADKFYQQAIKLKPDQLRFRHIYGLFLVHQKKYKLAKEQAKMIYAKKYPNQKLKQKLIKAGYWK